MIEHKPTIHRTPKAEPKDDQWWKGAVIYQIYPRSFADSNGDGVGDLQGIVAKIAHIKSLGADAVWISPFFQSPMKDFGYDVSDYCAVDPTFGTLDDFDQVLAAAKAHGLKLMIDFVPSHTSDQHPWFIESRADHTNPKADWYVWADAKPDGAPPNNWISVFGGPAWQWEPRRRQYYLHNFLSEQPDLNFHNPAVIDALLDCARFWLKRGVDGFRVDAIDFGVHDRTLADNPVRSDPGHTARTPFDMQIQAHNKAHPELCELFLKPLGRLAREYGATALLGEISGDHALKRMAEYSDGGGLDMVYSFDLLTTKLTPAAIRSVIENLEAHIDNGWACWAFSNHDVPRAVTRFGGQHPDPRISTLAPILLTCLRGTICLYQGEELGLPEATLRFDQLVDPVGIRFYPDNPGRDGCRTPMPWTAQSPTLGFSDGDPWLPLPDAHGPLALDRQDTDPQSTLNKIRAFFHWRRTQPALIKGDIRFIDAPTPVLMFERTDPTQSLLCVFNLGNDPVSVPLDAHLKLTDCPINDGLTRAGTLHLDGWSTTILQRDRETDIG